VGAKKFTYDVWGDTVNTAARMETNGEPGRINISASTHELIKEHFECNYRGKIAAKGKGEIDMYFVEGEKKKKTIGLKSSNPPPAHLSKGGGNPAHGLSPSLRGGAGGGAVNFLKLKEFILNKLKSELPSHLCYHGVHHTLDVYKAAENLAIEEKISKKETELLKVAALFHDSGFTKKYKGHEEEGCDIARSTLPDFNYTDEQIDTICGIIMATKIPQSPKNKLEEILCDADLDYLGRNDFHPIAETLFKELNATGNPMDKKKWNKNTIRFSGKASIFHQDR